jgi:NADH:ubiquinone oxidoreductase subunit
MATAFETWGKMQRCQIWDQGNEAQAPLSSKWQRYLPHVVPCFPTAIAAKKRMTKSENK